MYIRKRVSSRVAIQTMKGMSLITSAEVILTSCLTHSKYICTHALVGKSIKARE